MHVSIRDLKGLPAEKTAFLSFITGLGTDICANTSGNPGSLIQLHVRVVADVLKHV